jgi:hypothetical protein
MVFDAPAYTWRCAGGPFGFARGSLLEAVKSELTPARKANREEVFFPRISHILR